MKSKLRVLALVAVIGLLAAACGKSSSSSSSSSTSAAPATIQSGGTLNLGLASDVSASFDPQKEYYQVSWAIFQCCTLRTMLSYPAGTGPTALTPVPDLATTMPTVSTDGLTYTFHIKPNIHYSPPLQNVTVTSQDFARALMREANPNASANGYSFYYSVIQGFDQASKADKNVNTYTPISGVSTPDPSTLVIKLTQPTGDFIYRMTMAATAPIPPNPFHPSEPMGIATGHGQSFGPFAVGTGPYMFQGANQLDFKLPPSQQKPVSGYQPGKGFQLVRNPSWQQSTDSLRKAYPDGITAVIDTNPTDLYQKLTANTLDLVWATIPPNVLNQYNTQSNLRPFLHILPYPGTEDYISMNLGVAPFDDIHVRKAVNYVIDKSGLITVVGGPLHGVPATHIIPDGLLKDSIKGYDPYASPGFKGDLAKAQAEMKLSKKYDPSGDGKCDVAACKNVLTVIDESAPGPAEAQLINQDLNKIGISLNIKAVQRTTMYSECDDPTKHIGLCPSVGWVQDYADPYTFAPPLFGSASLSPGCCNYSLLGATSAQMKKWGYPSSIPTPPNVDSQMNACAPKAGTARTSCYASFDKYMMENVVPWIPWLWPNDISATSTRVTHWEFSNSIGIDQLNDIALKQ